MISRSRAVTPRPFEDYPMNLQAAALFEIDATLKFFERTIRCFSEADSLFRPQPEMMTVASHLAHVAQTVDWMREGGWGQGFDMDFESLSAETNKAVSFDAARVEVGAAFGRLRALLEKLSSDDLAQLLPANPILGECPRYHLIEAVVDHTAHHRGALSVYARLAGKTPDMPYGED
jgi:uncharacterized damage-inducible protein DinB